MSFNIRVEGLAKLNMKLRNIPLKFHPIYNEAIKKSIFDVERETKPITPVSKSRKGHTGGHLRKSISRGIGYSDLQGWIESKTKYGIFVHEGTRNWPLSKPPRLPGTVRQFLKVGTARAMPRINRYFDEATKKLIK